MSNAKSVLIASPEAAVKMRAERFRMPEQCSCSRAKELWVLHTAFEAGESEGTLYESEGTLYADHCMTSAYEQNGAWFKSWHVRVTPERSRVCVTQRNAIH